MSGAYDHTFNAPIPGMSIAHHRLGELPHERPPQFVDPQEALEYFWKQLNRPEIIQQIWHINKQGGTVWAITRAILFKAALEGIIQMNLGIVIYQTVQQMISVIIQAGGDKPNLHPKFKNKLRDQMIKEKMKEIIMAHGGARFGFGGKPDTTPQPQQAAPAPQEQQPQEQGAEQQPQQAPGLLAMAGQGQDQTQGQGA